MNELARNILGAEALSFDFFAQDSRERIAFTFLGEPDFQDESGAMIYTGVAEVDFTAPSAPTNVQASTGDSITAMGEW